MGESEPGERRYNVAAIGKKIYVSYAPPPGVESDVHGVIDQHGLVATVRPG